jgi:UDP-N-acetylglucosamine transferase subunit ALG13
MIFVTVSASPFERLIREMDKIAGSISEKAVMQIGKTKYEPKNADFFRFISNEEILEYNKKARLVITHGGAGCIMTALSCNKPVIVVPRYKKFGEHINDHQLDLTKALEREGKIIAVYDVKDLKKAIKSADKLKTAKSRPKLVEFLKKYINELDSRS